MKKIKTTVYITSRDYAKYLGEAIESVLTQSVNDWELFLINDGSIDGTKELMNVYKGDKRIHLFETNKIGLPAVANLAIKNARGKYIIRLDADDVFDENALLVLGNHLDRNPDISLVFPDYFLIDETGVIFAHERRQTLYYKNHILDMPANGACTMIRKDVLMKIGGYREDLGAQDGFDLWTKITKKYKCANISMPLFYYRRHGNNMTDNSHRILSSRREIKKDASRDILDDHRPIIAIIPCRENYDFCQNLWKQKIGNKTLLDLAIQKCLKIDLLDKVVVTADTSKVKSILDKYSDPRLIYINRHKEHTIRSRPIVQTIERVVNKLDIKCKGISVLSYIQAPFATKDTIEEAINTLIMNDADCSIALEEIREPLFKRTKYGLEQINSKSALTSDFDIIYGETRTCLATKNVNIKQGSLTGNKIVNFLIEKEERFFINNEQNLKIARMLQKLI
ncbi:MAG: glycosyltransferase [Candidatus Omnitrophica bacterium]|nr:glycosyltransferase [Candidatus Omnitrophota bacterium]